MSEKGGWRGLEVRQISTALLPSSSLDQKLLESVERANTGSI